MTLQKLYQSETKKYHIYVKDPDTDLYIDLETIDATVLKDLEAIVFTKNNNKEIKRMSREGTGDFEVMTINTDTSGNKYFILPLGYSIVKDIQPGQLAIQITIIWEDLDYGDPGGEARKSYVAELNPVRQAKTENTSG